MALDLSVSYVYFSFAEADQKLSYEKLLLSLIVQLVRSQPLLEELRRAKVTHTRDLYTLENIYSAYARRQRINYVVIDALDELPRGFSREQVMDGLHRCLRLAPNTKVLLTSRPEADIQDRMAECQATSWVIDENLVNADIKRFLERRLQKDRQLSQLPCEMKKLCERHFMHKVRRDVSH